MLRSMLSRVSRSAIVCRYVPITRKRLVCEGLVVPSCVHNLCPYPPPSSPARLPLDRVSLLMVVQTSNSKIFAVGDVCSRYQFTHASDFMARLVIRNTLFFGKEKFSSLIIPWCTYTEPEVAHVGLYASDMETRGTE